MKKLILPGLVLTFGTLGLFAVEKKANPQTKIGYVRLEALFSMDPAGEKLVSQEWLDELKKLEEAAKKINKDLEKARQNYEEAEKGFKEKEKLLDEKAKAVAKKDLEEKEMKIRQLQYELLGMQQVTFPTLQKDILAKAEKVAKKLANSNGMELILGGGVLYATPSLDLTDKLATALNKEYEEAKAKKQEPKAETKINEKDRAKVETKAKEKAESKTEAKAGGKK